MLPKLKNFIEKAIESNRNCRIAKARANEYRKLLLGQKFPDKAVDGEDSYLKLWRQLTDKVEPYSYRLYSHYIGKVPYIIPDYIGTEILGYYLNPRRYNDFYEDKNTYTSYLPLSNCLPETYLNRIGGGKMIYNQLFTNTKTILNFAISAADMANVLSKKGAERCILKPTIDSCSGHGVMMFLRNGNHFESSKSVILDGAFLKDYSNDFVLQEAITQHPDLAQFNPTSVNTLRICTYRSVENEEIRVTGALIRIGKQGEVVDNAHAGGCFVGIDLATGSLQHVAHDQYGSNFPCWNGIDFENNTFTIPLWEQVKTFAKSIAACNKHSRLLALDLTVDHYENPRFIEINIDGFSYWLFLFSAQDVFNGETQAVINYCNDRMAKDGRAKLV